MTTILKKDLYHLLCDIDDPRQNSLIKIYNEFKDLFHYAHGSSFNHQAWIGGYADHIAECLRINDIIYNALHAVRPLNFTKASAAIVLFFHDIEKPFRYGPKEDARCTIWQKKLKNDPAAWEEAKWDILSEIENKFHITFSKDEKNALKYTHGEGHDHRKDARIASPLAAHVHHCDNISARIWFNDGQNLSLST
jgi:hypothetical protein